MFSLKNWGVLMSIIESYHEVSERKEVIPLSKKLLGLFYTKDILFLILNISSSKTAFERPSKRSY